MINEQYKYSELTSKIIGCAMTVHQILGNRLAYKFWRNKFKIQEINKQKIQSKQ